MLSNLKEKEVLVMRNLKTCRDTNPLKESLTSKMSIIKVICMKANIKSLQDNLYMLLNM
jgi:hypothetical protein